MATILSEASSPLAVDLWQLDHIRDLFDSGFSIEDKKSRLSQIR
jgi:hypothetical protein